MNLQKNRTRYLSRADLISINCNKETEEYNTSIELACIQWDKVGFVYVSDDPKPLTPGHLV